MEGKKEEKEIKDRKKNEKERKKEGERAGGYLLGCLIGASNAMGWNKEKSYSMDKLGYPHLMRFKTILEFRLG